MIAVLSCPFSRSTSLAAAVFAASVPLGSLHAETVQPAPCAAPTELTRLQNPLSRTSQRLAAGMPITIVAIGSSSTQGAGASTPAMSYPSRLAVELKQHFPRADITVINRGVGGETATEMVARFDKDVLDERPDIVIWQVGSNSLLRNHPVKPAGLLIRKGVKRLKASGADVILMNPQYAPKVNANLEAEVMVDQISDAAKEAGVDLFERFAVMRYWRLTESIPFKTFISDDELHMNDWSYGCVAKLLAGAIAEAATRPTMSAGASTAAARPAAR
jgi:acyl-CoA thioesterase-1